MRNRAFTFWQMLVLLAVVGVLAAILFPVFGRRTGTSNRPSCRMNLKLIGFALMQYSQDYDEKYPLVSSNQGGWTDNLQPYVKSRWVFSCSTARAEGKVDETVATSDFFYNARLVGMSFDDPKLKANLAYPQWTIMCGDGIAGGPTDSNLRALPFSWRNDPASPAARHKGEANYLFADASVRTLKAALIDDGPRRKAKDRASFAVQ